MFFFNDSRHGLQRSQQHVSFGFNKKHIYKSYKDNLKANSVDKQKIALRFNTLCKTRRTVKALYCRVDKI